MKFAVSTYSFAKLFCTKELNQLSCIKKAKEIGFDEIEFLDIIPHDGTNHLEYAKKLGAACAQRELGISCYTFGAELLSCNDLPTEIERIKKQIDIAAVLGAPRIRHDASCGYIPGMRGYKGFDDALPILADACGEITRYAKEKGLLTSVENHGFFCQHSHSVEKLVNAVADDNFGILCDMGNFLCVDEDPIQAVSRLAPYTTYVHAKDFIIKDGMGADPGTGFFHSLGGNYLRGTIIGHGVVPVKQCIRILQNAGFDGTISIEFEGMEDTIEALQIGLHNLKNYMKCEN